MKKNKDAIQTCLCDLHPNISNENADRSHATIETTSTAKEMSMRFEFHFMRLEHSGSRHRYHVKYCAVITLLKVTNANVWQNNAKLKSYGAIPKLENPSNMICGRRGMYPQSEDVL
mmetsp:Transcript_9526/g.15053  ORF Transcript_9526/g.15053 Transcript_9526/m.15053 type:complete len:116 (-) Transcript_9526:99-446(-)